MICHLSDVDVERLFKEYLILFIIDILQQTTSTSMLMNQQIINMAHDFDNRYSGIVNILN